MGPVKKIVRLALLGIFALPHISGHASVITYSDRALFETTLTNIQIDDFNSLQQGIVNSAAVVKANSVASIGYESTFYTVPDWNISVGGGLCWGCNGSGRIILDDTSIGSSAGVFGFGFDLRQNDSSLPYDAFVTFGDDSTQVFDLPVVAFQDAASFFGLTSDMLVKEVHFTQESGEITGNGSFRLDNVTIGNVGDSTPVPGPSPLALIGLGLIALRMRHKVEAKFLM